MPAEVGNWTKQQLIYTRNFWDNVQVSIYSNVAPNVEFSIRDRRIPQRSEKKLIRVKSPEKKIWRRNIRQFSVFLIKVQSFSTPSLLIY